jgi:hypothetical protein
MLILVVLTGACAPAPVTPTARATSGSPTPTMAAVTASPTVPHPASPVPEITTAPSPAPSETPMSAEGSRYFWHHDIVASVFWIGEEAGPDNDYISNESTAWVSDSVSSFGGIDTPDTRNPDNPYHPAGFVPRENPFYIALPAGEYDENGLLPGAREKSPWADEAVPESGSLFKNRWVHVVSTNPDGLRSECYGQWEDVGPNEETDYGYVFCNAPPENDFGLGAGIDVSPATAICLGFDGTVSRSSGTVSWRFIDAVDVPPGPWLEITTESGPDW